MRWTWSILAACVFSITLHASDVVVLEDIQISIADSYTGTAFFVVDSREESSAWKKVDFSIGMDYLSMNVYQILPGLGESVMEARYGDFRESWLIHPSRFQATRSKRFANTLTDAGEVDLSPMPILRMLLNRMDQLEIKEMDIEKTSEGTNGLVTLQISDATGMSPGYSEIDVVDGRIVEYRANKIKDKFMVIVEYGEWVQLPCGEHVPTLNVSKVRPTDSDGNMIIQTVQIKDIAENEASYRPEKPQITPDLTIIDHIDGVTKIDGEVIAPIQYGDQSASSQATSSADSGRKASELFVWLGVGFVVLAGIILGIRTKAARG